MRVFIAFFFIFLSFSFFVFLQKPQLIKPTSVRSQEMGNEEKIPLPKVTLDSIFSDNHIFVRTFPSEKIRTLIVTGDVLLARSVNYQTVSRNNFNWPFEKTADVLRGGDITFINLETPLIENCPLTNTGMSFCGDLRNIDGLLFAGVDVVHIANNHISNFGVEGVKSTITNLNEKGLIVSGVDGAVYKEVKGLRFAFLGYNEVNFQEGVSLAEVEKVKREVAVAKKQSNIVVVQFHWGNEYTTEITQNQRELAHAAIDAGADLIVGNHPHWIQPLEIYKGKVITYAHGNFIFDQEWSQKTKEGIVGRYTFYEDELVDVELMPVLIEHYGQPSLIEGERKRKILEEVKQESVE